jgi:hypothetical protein
MKFEASLWLEKTLIRFPIQCSKILRSLLDFHKYNMFCFFHWYFIWEIQEMMKNLVKESLVRNVETITQKANADKESSKVKILIYQHNFISFIVWSCDSICQFMTPSWFVLSLMAANIENDGMWKHLREINHTFPAITCSWSSITNQMCAAALSDLSNTTRLRVWKILFQCPNSNHQAYTHSKIISKIALVIS